MSVDLPAPDLPIIPTISPSNILIEISFIAVVSENFLTSELISREAIIILKNH